MSEICQTASIYCTELSSNILFKSFQESKTIKFGFMHKIWKPSRMFRNLKGQGHDIKTGLKSSCLIDFV
jgi:hypothetical protein